MTEQGKYEDMLSWDNLPEEQLVPSGTWLLRCRNAVFSTGKDGAFPKVLFFYEAKEPVEGIDPEALEQFQSSNAAPADVVVQFFAKRKKDWDAVKEHLALLGVEAKGSIPDTLKAAKGAEIIGWVDVETFTSKQTGSQETKNVANNFTTP